MNDAFDGMVLAPWDEDTVNALSEWQRIGITHPYTCPRDHRDPETGRIDRTEQVLEATEEGWICPAEECGYTQRWAHRSSVDPKNLQMLRGHLEEIAGWRS